MKGLYLVPLFLAITLAIPLGDYLWCDSNLNGLQDVGEHSLYGITVELTDTNNTILATTTTDLDGRYQFDVAPNALYVVRVRLSNNVDLLVQPTLVNQGTNTDTNSKALYMILAGVQYAAVQVTVPVAATAITNIDFGFDCVNCVVSTNLYDVTRIATLNNPAYQNTWGYTAQRRHGNHVDRVSFRHVTDDDSDYETVDRLNAGSVVEAAASDSGRMACLTIKPAPGVTVGQVDYVAFSAPLYPLSLSTQVLFASADGQNITSRLTLQNYTGGDVCAGRGSCGAFPAPTSVFGLTPGDLVMCVGCNTEFFPAPLQICFANVTSQQLGAHVVKAHVRSVIGYTVGGAFTTEVSVIGMLPPQCDYVFRQGDDVDEHNNGQYDGDDDGGDDDDNGDDDDDNGDDDNEDDDDSEDGGNGEIVVIVRN